ncbi:kinase-like protein [Imleria badia]|nr:kinase-like protein [Imleria badia]
MAPPEAIAKQASKDASKVIRIIPEAPSLFIECMSGGQVLGYTISHGRLHERVARKFTRQIGNALDYCHRNNVVHRASELLNAKVYTGPEVDVWSFGVVLYVLVCGRFPSMPALHAKIKRGFVEHPVWLGAGASHRYPRTWVCTNLTNRMQHLLSRMLVTNLAARASLAELLEHPWMGFAFGSEKEIERKLVAVLDSEAYIRAVATWEQKTRSKQRLLGRILLHLLAISFDGSSSSIHKGGLTPSKKSKRFSGFDFYRRKLFSPASSPLTPSHSPPNSQPHLSITDAGRKPMDPTRGFHPLISMRYFTREKLEEDDRPRKLLKISGLRLVSHKLVVSDPTDTLLALRHATKSKTPITYLAHGQPAPILAGTHHSLSLSPAITRQKIIPDVLHQTAIDEYTLEAVYLAWLIRDAPGAEYSLPPLSCRTRFPLRVRRRRTAVVDVLARTDNTLQRYTLATDAWREQLVALKALEDDLAAVLRDRDILVTCPIKASKSPRDAHRTSRLIGPLTSLGSASFSSLPSTNSTASSSPASTHLDAKLAQAQAELQAREAHLVTKEHELNARRITIARDDLGARYCALIVPKPPSAILPHLCTNGNPTYTSDNSSLTPSQSASQTAAMSVETSHEGPTSRERGHVPETTSKLRAHLDDGDLLSPSHPHMPVPSPNNASSHTPFPTNTTTAVHDTSTDDERSLQAVENDPFEVICRSMIGPAPAAHASAPDVRTSVVYEPSPTKGAFLSSASAGHGMSTGIGSISKTQGEGEGWCGPSSPSPVSLTRAESGGWVTRTDGRIKRGRQADLDDDFMARQGDGDDDDDERCIGARLRKGRPSAAVRNRGYAPWHWCGRLDHGQPNHG